MNEREASTEAALARRSKRVFDERLAALDCATRAELRAARLQAVHAGVRHRPFGRVRRRWLAAAAFGGLAAILLAVRVSSPGPASSHRNRLDVTNPSDLALLLRGEDFDLVQNLEFYAWLEERGHAKSAGKTARTDNTG